MRARISVVGRGWSMKPPFRTLSHFMTDRTLIEGWITVLSILSFEKSERFSSIASIRKDLMIDLPSTLYNPKC